MFTCPGMEQVYDLAMSTPSSQVYVVSQVLLLPPKHCQASPLLCSRLHRLHVLCNITQENFYVFNGEGQPMCAISMADWPGVHAHPLLMMDVGAFSWPLPNTSRVAFHLEATNAIYIVDLAAR